MHVINSSCGQLVTISKLKIGKNYVFVMISVHPPAGVAGPAFSILDVMRVAQLASCDLRRNISKTCLQTTHHSITIAELFYLATM